MVNEIIRKAKNGNNFVRVIPDIDSKHPIDHNGDFPAVGEKRQ